MVISCAGCWMLQPKGKEGQPTWRSMLIKASRRPSRRTRRRTQEVLMSQFMGHARQLLGNHPPSPLWVSFPRGCKVHQTAVNYAPRGANRVQEEHYPQLRIWRLRIPPIGHWVSTSEHIFVPCQGVAQLGVRKVLPADSFLKLRNNRSFRISACILFSLNFIRTPQMLYLVELFVPGPYDSWYELEFSS